QGSNALAPIGLISFAGVAQFIPAVLAALYWRGATEKGALAGIFVGFVIWAWTLFLPSFASSCATIARLVADGPFGIGLLRAVALFGMCGMDPLVHSVFWSLLLNIATMLCTSTLTRHSALERVQSALFTGSFRRSAGIQPQLIRG